MCGRYRLTAKERYIRDHFGLYEDPAWTPRWNIAPTQSVPVIRQDKKEPKRTFALLRWGLIPYWTLLANSSYALSRTALESWPGEIRTSDLLVPNYESANSKCFIWCRLGSTPFFLSLTCTELIPKNTAPLAAKVMLFFCCLPELHTFTTA
jgi:hypothetical protein